MPTINPITLTRHGQIKVTADNIDAILKKDTPITTQERKTLLAYRKSTLAGAGNSTLSPTVQRRIQGIESKLGIKIPACVGYTPKVEGERPDKIINENTISSLLSSIINTNNNINKPDYHEIFKDRGLNEKNILPKKDNEAPIQVEAFEILYESDLWPKITNWKDYLQAPLDHLLAPLDYLLAPDGNDKHKLNKVLEEPGK